MWVAGTWNLDRDIRTESTEMYKSHSLYYHTEHQADPLTLSKIRHQLVAKILIVVNPTKASKWRRNISVLYDFLDKKDTQHHRHHHLVVRSGELKFMILSRSCPLRNELDVTSHEFDMLAVLLRGKPVI